MSSAVWWFFWPREAIVGSLFLQTPSELDQVRYGPKSNLVIIFGINLHDKLANKKTEGRCHTNI